MPMFLKTSARSDLLCTLLYPVPSVYHNADPVAPRSVSLLQTELAAFHVPLPRSSAPGTSHHSVELLRAVGAVHELPPASFTQVTRPPRLPLCKYPMRTTRTSSYVWDR